MIDQTITLPQINAARAKLNRLNDGRRIRDDQGACRFIAERGFVLLMPLDGVPLPSLSRADEAEPWNGFAITDRAWAWKETLPGKKLCAYSKLIHGRGTFIDWGIYPSFLRVYGPDGDIDYEWENGRLNRAERDLYQIVARSGPIDSHELWREAKPIFEGKRHHFTAALERLQSGFFLTVAGGSLEGWTLHTWDLVERQAPPEVLRKLPRTEEARINILHQTFQNCLAAPERQLRSILRWQPEDLKRTVAALRNEGWLTEVAIPGESQPWLMMKGI